MRGICIVAMEIVCGSMRRDKRHDAIGAFRKCEGGSRKRGLTLSSAGKCERRREENSDGDVYRYRVDTC